MTTPTLLSPYRWAQLMGLDPLHFSQVTLTSQYDSGQPMCGTPTFQWDWQDSDKVGRETVARAIRVAEDRMANFLGYEVLPNWVVEDVLQHDQHWLPEAFPVPVNLRGMRRSVELTRGWFCGGGTEAKAAISAGAAVVYTNPGSDPIGYNGLATIGPVATTETDPDRIAVYLQASDTHTTAADDEWEVKPLATVVISGGFVTVTCRREQLVKPDLITAIEPQAVDGTVNGNFVTAVDVYRHYTDPATQVQMQWEPGGGIGCSGSDSCASCGLYQQNGCLLPRDERLGIVSFAPADYDADTAEWTLAGWSACRAPDRVLAYYRAGYRDRRKGRPYQQMDPLLEDAVAKMAAALLERPLCGCDNVTAYIRRWQTDLAFQESNPTQSFSRQLGQRVLDNPWGTRRGEVYAWDLCREKRIA